MTMNAGLGRTINATPNKTTVPPMTAMTIRFIWDEGIFAFSQLHFKSVRLNQFTVGRVTPYAPSPRLIQFTIE